MLLAWLGIFTVAIAVNARAHLDSRQATSCCPNGQYTDNLSLACNNPTASSPSTYGDGQVSETLSTITQSSHELRFRKCYDGWLIGCNSQYASGDYFIWEYLHTPDLGACFDYCTGYLATESFSVGFDFALPQPFTNAPPPTSYYCFCQTEISDPVTQGGYPSMSRLPLDCLPPDTTIPVSECCPLYTGLLDDACGRTFTGPTSKVGDGMVSSESMLNINVQSRILTISSVYTRRLDYTVHWHF
jgi:hypothetical protein